MCGARTCAQCVSWIDLPCIRRLSTLHVTFGSEVCAAACVCDACERLDLLQLRSFMALARHVTLPPSEYQGDPNTCVAGRVVILRGPITLRQRESATGSQPAASTPAATQPACKGKGKKGGKKPQGKGKQEERVKSELHVLGGDTADEVLFGDGWANNARELVSHLELGKCYRIAGTKYMAKPPEYSTSRLAYFIRFEGAFGTQILIEEVTVSPWVDVPLFHPFADIKALTRVGSKLQTCIAGIIQYQPGLIDRDTKFGPSQVCNAVLKQGNHDIRCSFWREQGAALADLPVGTVTALLQINVVQNGGSWECRATESTQLMLCPESLKQDILANTDLDSAGVSLTKHTSIDYDTVSTTSVTLSALAAIISPKGSRDLGGVYEVHNCAILGVSAVLTSGTFKMIACKECFRQVQDMSAACNDHPDAGTASRWMFSLEIADGGCSLPAMLYHDQAATLAFLSDKVDSSDPAVKQQIVREFRAAPWSFRLIFKPDVNKDGNYLEIKKLTPTITSGGVVETYTHVNAPRALEGRPGCPFACCSDVSFDPDFGIVRCHEVDAAAVRVLLKVEAHTAEDKDIATADPTGLGLRVCRKVSCGLKAGDTTRYFLCTSGVISAVQWLLTAPAGTAFYVTATVRTSGDTLEFRAVAFVDVTATIGIVPFAAYMKDALASAATTLVEFTPSKATPQARKRAIDKAAEESGASHSGTFSKRSALGN